MTVALHPRSCVHHLVRIADPGYILPELHQVLFRAVIRTRKLQ